MTRPVRSVTRITTPGGTMSPWTKNSCKLRDEASPFCTFCIARWISVSASW